MSENIKGIKINIDANFTALSRSINNSKSLFKSLGKQVKEVKDTMKFDKAFDGTEQQIKLVNKAITESKNHVKRLEEAFDKLKNSDKHTEELTKEFTLLQLELSKAKDNVAQFENELKKLENPSKNTVKNIKGLGENLRFLGSSFKEIYTQSQGIDKVKDKISTMGIAMGHLASVGIQKALHGMKELSVTSVRSGVQFEEAIANLKALYGSDLSQKELDKVIAKAKELGDSTVYNATEVAQAMRSMALAGYNSKQTIESIESALNLASASGEEFSVVSNILVDGLKAFGYETDQAERFANSLGLTAVVTNADVADLGEAFKYVGAVAGTFKYNIEDVSVALGAMASNGIKGSTAGTSLRQMLLRLATDKKAQGAFASIGGQFYDVTGKAKPLLKVLEDLRKGLGKLNDKQKASILNKIAGQRAVTGLSAIVSMSEENWKNLTKELKNADGAVKSIAEKRLDNLNGDIKLMKNSLENAKLTLFDTLQPALRKIFQDINKMIKSISFQRIINDIGKFVGTTLKGLNSALKFVVKHIDLVVFAIRTLLPLIVVGGNYIKFAQWFLTLAKTAGVASSTIQTINAALITVGLTLGGVTLAIAGAIALLKLWDTYHRNTNQALYESADRIKAQREQYALFREEMQKNLQNISQEYNSRQTLLKELDRYVEKNGKIKEGYEARVNYILGELQKAYGIEVEVMDKTIKKYDELKTKLEEISKQKLIDSLMGEYANQQKEALELYTSSLNENAKYVQDYKNVVVKELEEIKKAGENHILFNGQNGEFDTKKYQEFMSLSGEAQLSWVALNGIFSQQEQLIISNFNKTSQDMQTSLQSLDEANMKMKTLSENADKSMQEILVGHTSKYSNIAKMSKDEILTKLSELQNELLLLNHSITNSVDENTKTTLEAHKEQILLNMQELNTAMAEIYNNPETNPVSADKLVKEEEIQKTSEKADNLNNAIKNSIDKKRPEIQESAKQNAETLPKELEKVVPKGGESALNFANTAISNIHSKVGEMYNAGASLGGALIGGFNNSLQIHSPSRKAIQSAGFFIQGITNTISTSIPKVTSVVEKLGSSMVGSLSTFTNSNDLGIEAIQKIENKIDVGSSLMKALEKTNFVADVNIDLDGRELTNRVSMAQGLQLKRGY